MKDIPGTLYRTQDKPDSETLILPSFKEIKEDKRKFAQSFNLQQLNTDPFNAKVIAESYPGEWVIQNIPAMPLNREELDWVFSLSYNFV